MPIPRNPIRSWTDVYMTLKPYLEELRGLVEINSDTPEVEHWPRTTGADVIAIAATLDRAFADAPLADGFESTYRQWHACRRELEREAFGDPHAVYAGNRAFWHCAGIVCVHLDAAGERPYDDAFWRAFFLELDQPPHGHRNAAEIRLFTMFMNDWRAYLDRRGPDDRVQQVPPLPVPRTTNADVQTLSIAWNGRLSAAMARHPAKLDGAARKWNACLAQTTAATKNAAADSPYADNRAFWSCLGALASALDDVAPPDVASMLDDVANAVSNIFDDLPGSIEHGAATVAHETGQVLGGIASGFGDVAGKAVKGFLGEFTTPLLVIGGGVAAIYLLTREHEHSKEA